jgi:hypothetical protein
MKTFIACALIFIYVLDSSAQLSLNWSTPVAVPKYVSSSSARGSVGNNMVITSSDKVIIFSEENYTLNNKMTRIISYSLTTDYGISWIGATPHPGVEKTPAPFGINVAIDVNDNIHTTWISSELNKVYYMKFDKNMNSLTDTIYISDMSKTKLTVSDVKITVDRKNRVHIFWMDGNSKTQIPEIKYARSTNGGYKWEKEQLLSIDDGMKSCFPRADFTGAGTDNLAIVWRDSSTQIINGTTYENWKLVWALSKNGGKTWVTSTAYDSQDSEWDPGLIIDKKNNLHINYTLVPAIGDKIQTRIIHQSTNTKGANWYAGPLMISPDEPSELTAFNYGYLNDEIWLFWKNDNNGQKFPNIECSFSKDNGISWQAVEKLTNYDSISNQFTLGYKGTHVGSKGLVAINYDVTEFDKENFTIYFRYRKPGSNQIITGLGLDDSNLESYTVYYSADEKKIKLNLNDKAFGNINSVQIYNSCGELCINLDNVNASNSTAYVDVSKLKESIYFIQINADNKIIKSTLYVN